MAAEARKVREKVKKLRLSGENSSVFVHLLTAYENFAIFLDFSVIFLIFSPISLPPCI